MAKTKQTPEPEFTPLAVIGVGGVFPKARSLREYWANIKNKVDAIREVPASHWSPADYFDADPKKADKVYAAMGGFLEPYDFDPSEFGLSPNTLEATDPAQLFALVAAKMALADAGYPVDKDSWDRARVSCILGVTGTLEIAIGLGARLSHPVWRKALADAGISPALAEDVVARISDGFVPWQEASFPGLLGNVVAGRVANRFNLGGTNCVVDAACGSSLAALHMASLELSARRASMVITGGVDTFNDIFMYTCFTKTPALSASGHAKSFDAKADGTTLGEGVGMIVLKRLDDARRDGDVVHAIIRGVGSSSDGRGKSIYAPSAEGQTRALKEAYRVSGVGPGTVELVEAHGTGTAVGDGIEVGALTEVYRDGGREGQWCALGSVKSMIGHTKSAAGAASLIKATMALRHKVLPPTLKVVEPLPVLAKGDTPFYLSLEKRPWWSSPEHPRRAAVSALGFGGTNFHAVLEEASPEKTETDWDGDAQIIALSGATRADVTAALDAWSRPMTWDEVRLAAAAARKVFNPSAHYRLCFCVDKSTDVAQAARKAATGDGAFLGEGRPGKLGILFPGQGAQYVGMGRDLACVFPEAFEALAAYGDVGAKIFPRPGWTTAQKEEQELALRATDVAQPALGAVGLAAWRVLSRFGLRADAAAGHSYGELAALHIAGRFDADALAELSRLRGSLMKGDGGDRGTMLAVQAGLTELLAVLKTEALDLVVANRNAPTQNVLSGSKAEIERAEKVLSGKGLRCVRLPVAAAFHSPLVSPALKPFAAALEKIEFHTPSLPVYANSTGEAYPVDAKKSRELLSGQLAKPVEFVALVTRMHDDGVRTFVEVGAGARLTGLVGQILKGREFTAAALDASSGKKNGLADLARLLAQLSALGYPVDLAAWQGGDDGVKDCRPKPKMSVVLTGATYRSTPRKTFPARAAAPIVADVGLTGQALAAAQASIDALNKLQEQTAALHLQFLQSQETSQRQIQALVEQQQALSARIVGVVPQVAPAMIPAPIPVPFAKRTESAVMPVLLAIVSEKTGYPAETLNADMDLEGDLGIDSIKRVEILSAVREKLPNAPQVKPEHLGTLRTLKLIADYLGQGAVPAPTSSVMPVLLAIVSEKTGYPAETLNADMDLEGDLGIDSIKRVEILSAVREKLPNAPQVKPEHLGTLRTLKLIADYLSAGAPAPAPAPAPSVMPVLLAIVSEKTGYPAETLNADMDLEGDLGIDSIKRVEILSAVREKLPNAPQVKPEHLGTLRTLKLIADYLSAGAAAAAAPVTVPSPAPVPAGASLIVRSVPVLVSVGPRDIYPLKGIVIAVTKDSGLDDALARELRGKGLDATVVSLDKPEELPAELGALIVIAPSPAWAQGAPWSAESEAWLKRAFFLVQAAGRGFAARGARGLIATVTRLDGALGFSGAPGRDPAYGAIAGLMKTAAREWPKVACRAIDVDPALSVDAAAAMLAKELGYEGPVETALSSAGARTVALNDQAAISGPDPLSAGDVVIVTGGARGVTAACARALAREFKPRLVLVGRSPAPEAEDAGLKGARTEAELRRALSAAHPGLAPKEIAARAKAALAAREIRATLDELGSAARYESCDARDESAVKALIAKVEAELGPVRGLVHGAGVLADKALVEKTPEQFDVVLETKLSGLRHFLNSLELSRLKLLSLFSSSTARHGRVGQSDYAVANEALNKIGQALAARLPSCRVNSVGWGPWDGGMVDAGLAKMFSAEGVGLIGLRAGADHLIAETRGADVESTAVAQADSAPADTAEAFERALTLEDSPILKSHVFGGRAVAPLALSAEWLAHAALHGNPGMKFLGFDDLRVIAPIAVRPGEATTISVRAAAALKRDGLWVVPAEIRGGDGGVRVSARVVLGTQWAKAPTAKVPVSGEAYCGGLEKAYGRVLFHGPELRVITDLPVMSPEGFVAISAPTPSPSLWMKRPLRDRWIADPAALDAAFQAAILWTQENMGAPSLPSFAARYRQFAEAFPEGGVRISARVLVRGSVASADVDFLDERGALVARLEGFESTAHESLASAFRDR